MPRSSSIEMVLPGGGRLVRPQHVVLCHEEFASGPPYRPGDQQFDDRDRRYVIWRRSDQASVARIVAEIGASRSTVAAVIRWAASNSENLVRCGIVTKVAPGYRQRRPRWACTLDGQQFSDPANASRWAWDCLVRPEEHRFAPMVDTPMN